MVVAMTVLNPEQPMIASSVTWPVLAHTAKRLNQFAEQSDAVEVKQLTELILDDPAMAFRLLSDVDSILDRPPTMTTVTSAILLLGIEPFFERYVGLSSVEQTLESNPLALQEYRRLVRLSRRAARLVGAFCVPCHDPDVGGLFLAGLLHALASLRDCVERPEQVITAKRTLPDLAETGSILEAAGFPEPFARLITGDQERLDPQMRRVRLAILIASALENGWSSPELADLLAELSALLGLSRAGAIELVRSVPV